MTVFDDKDLPTQFGAWRRGMSIGSGGAGAVYLADHVETKAVGALKVSHAKLGAEARHWFHREAALAARLRHPYIVPLLDKGDVDGRSFLVYEHAPGPTVAEVADELDLDGIARVGRHLFEALTYAHDAGVVHCDITPSNVILTPSETHVRETRLIDFGLASAQDERGSHQVRGVVSGTPGYISPEQVRGQRLLGPTTDLFAVGALLFRLLCGYPRYAGALSNALYLKTPLPCADRFGLGESSPIVQVVLRLLAEDPERRYPSAATARRAWSDAVSAAPLASAAPPAVKPAQPLVTVNTQLASTQSRLPERAPATHPQAKPTPRLVARTNVVHELAQRIRSSSNVCLLGPAGSGKSQLAQDTAQHLQGEMRVVQVCGRRGVESPPLECLASIVLGIVGGPVHEPLWRSAERIHQLVVSLDIEDAASAEDALLGGLLGTGPSADARSAVMAGVEVLRALVGSAPLLVLIDDADHVDESTWQVLDALNGSDLRVLRVHDKGSIQDVESLESPIQTNTFQLPEFQNRETLWQLFGGEGATPPGTLADLRALAALKLDPKATRFDSLPADVAHALRAAYALGADIPERGLLDLGASEETVDWLIAAGVFVRVDTSCARHERWLRAPSETLGRLALESLNDPDRAETDLRPLAVRWLSRCCRDAPNTNLPRVAQLAETCGLTPSAAYAWSEAGQLASRAQRPAAAAALERALDLNRSLSRDEEAIDRPRVLAELSAAYLAAARPQDADVCASEALDGLRDRDVLRTRLLRLRAQAAFASMDNQRALTFLQQAVELMGDDGDPMESASAHASLGWLLGYRMGRNEEGIAHGKEALRIASRIVAPAFQASLCGRLGANYLRAGDWDGQLQANLRDLRLSTEAHDVYGRVRANINLGVCFTNRGVLESARQHTERAYVLGIRHGARAAAAVAANNMALIASHDGQAEEATLWIERVMELSGDELSTETHLSQARVHLLEGKSTEARLVLARAAIQADHADKEHLARVGALIALTTGTPDQAYEWTARALETAASDPYERATTQLTHAACLRAMDRDQEALALEAIASETLARLGADLRLERRRWTPDRNQ